MASDIQQNYKSAFMTPIEYEKQTFALVVNQSFISSPELQLRFLKRFNALHLGIQKKIDDFIR